MCIFFLIVSDAKAELEREMAAEENLPAVKHHQLREFSGMLEYHKEDEQLLIRNLITGKFQCSIFL